MRKALGLVAKPVTDPARVQLPPYYPDLPGACRYGTHYDNIHAMDQRVGEILALRDDGLADSTIVIWTADHGDGLPRAKRELFDSESMCLCCCIVQVNLSPKMTQPSVL